MNQKLCFIFCCFFFICFSKAQKLEKTKRSKDDVEIMIANAGFESEVHYAETEDGYILKVHRILRKANISRPGPVFMLHGILETSADYIRTGPEIALPYLLSELGYDVWLGNVRGNDHSLNHKTLSVDSKAFWDFSFHEFGYYDAPAMFNLMLKITNSSRGFYFGHSQGGSTFAVMNSMRPEFNRKVIQAHLLAPGVFMKNLPNPLREAAFVAIEALAKRESYGLQNKEFAKYTDKISEIFCSNPFGAEEGMGKVICNTVMGVFVGFNKGEEEMDSRIMPSYLEHTTHSISLKQFLHFMHIYKNGRFSHFDYGPKNLKIYGSESPPDYPIEKITAPVFLYAGSCDMMISEIDLTHLSKVLPNLKKFKVMSNYNHVDFMYARNSRPNLYNEIVQSMSLRSKKNLTV